MRGSIAVWYDAEGDDAQGYAPRVEVHINIWKGSRSKGAGRCDLLDIGFRFSELRLLSTLSISLPFVVEQSAVTDLFEVMNDNSTLSAIFNESLVASDQKDDGRFFPALNEGGKVAFNIFRCAPPDISLSTIGDGTESGTVIQLQSALFERMRARIGDQYIRLRIRVPIGTPGGFISEVEPEETPFLSTILTNEIVEFRLNERRNFSPDLRSKLSGKRDLIDISAVHYFLIREMTVEMTQSHTGFRKMRRLEPRIWDRYLEDEPQIDASNMIIYHWSNVASGGSSVESFTALATFRAYHANKLWIYALVIVALGSMGSAVQAAFVALFSLCLPDSCSGWLVTVSLNCLLLAVGIILLCALLHWPRWRLRKRRKHAIG